MLAIEQFERAAAFYPDRICVADGARSISYAEMADLVENLANALIASGVGPGESVAILSPNDPLVLACQYAILRAGCVWIPANGRNLPADTALQFDRFEVCWLFLHSASETYFEGIRNDLPNIRGVIGMDASLGGLPALEDWVASFPDRHPLPDRSMDDIVWIAPTGGTTTGQLKGAVHTNASFETCFANFQTLHRFEDHPIHLVVAPLTHAAGIFHWCMVGIGGTHVISPGPDPESILGAIERYRINILFLPPTLLYMLLAHPGVRDRDTSSLHYFSYGAAPTAIEKVKEAVSIFGPVMYQGYGSVEVLVSATSMTPSLTAEALENPELSHRLGSVGRECAFCRIGIMDDDGALLPAGEIGEIVVRGGSLMREYYRDPERSAETRRLGWHHSGDVGYKDPDGFIYLVDRKHDMIITGGFNVYPGEIEQVVLSHPDIQDCAVVGVPHEKWGEMVHVAVEMKAGHNFDESAFLGFCRERLGGVKTPKQVEVLDTMPRSAVGKVLRREVRAPHWRDRQRNI